MQRWYTRRISRRNLATLAPLLFILVAGELGCASVRAARLYQSGTRALDEGSPVRAIADLERAATLWPRRSEIQNHLGLAYAAAGREHEAGEAFRRALELDCENSAARENLAAFEGPGTREIP